MTGAQEALPDTGPQPAAPAWGTRGAGGFPQAGNAAYPEQWYDNPRLDGPPVASRPADPRLEGINYGELRYDPDPADPVTPGKPGHDEPLDDESWYQELRRTGPAYPQRSGPQGGPSGPPRWVEPRGRHRFRDTGSRPVTRRRRIGRPVTASPGATGEAQPHRSPRPRKACRARRAAPDG